MKKLLIAFSMLATTASGTTSFASPQEKRGETAPATMEVTKQEFLKHITAMHQKSPKDVLVVMFTGVGKDPWEVKYDGANDADVAKALERAVAGDKVTVTPSNKASGPATVFMLK
ncbi:MAG: hypothetical protein EOP49_51785 [Sphingobacteriales bacterium]|nr:MAG: hypothetical protein EOP49_51785 [Sphingobacteriales bacterium]